MELGDLTGYIQITRENIKEIEDEIPEELVIEKPKKKKRMKKEKKMKMKMKIKKKKIQINLNLNLKNINGQIIMEYQEIMFK